MCTSDLIHILNGDSLTHSLNSGGYCQPGNVDYDKINNVYDQELITEQGLYFTFDGTGWTQKTNLASDAFGDQFQVANIDDDPAEEVLSQFDINQVQAFSPSSLGSRVYISALTYSASSFNVIDVNQDSVFEIIFDWLIEPETEDDVKQTGITLTRWDDVNDSHVNDDAISSPFDNVGSIKLLATSLDNIKQPQNYYYFFSNINTVKPNTPLFHRVNPNTPTTDLWNGFRSTASRLVNIVAKTGTENSIEDYAVIQLEQHTEENTLPSFLFKQLPINDFNLGNNAVPEFNTLNTLKISSLTAFDFDGDGIDELHAGGQAKYTVVYPDESTEDVEAGLIMTTDLNGVVNNHLLIPHIDTVTALVVEDLNQQGTTDYFISGKNRGDDGGIGFQFYYDLNQAKSGWFRPGTSDTDFKELYATNIKGGTTPEILGLHSQLSAYDPNAPINGSSFYNLSNMEFVTVTPIKLPGREYEYALAADVFGNLHLIEPKDFDILATHKGCATSLSSLTRVRLDNDLNVAMAVCEDEILSWAIEFDVANEQAGYNFYSLKSYPIAIDDTSESSLTPVYTDNGTVLIALFKNKYYRFDLKSDIGLDTDQDGFIGYKDAFPNVNDQWADLDKDGFGDNMDGTDPDPSPNDFDNDGVTDDQDPDNNPENDLNLSNDSDDGLPIFTDTPLATIKAENIGLLTAVVVAAPNVSDVYDNFSGNSNPTAIPYILGLVLEAKLDEDGAEIIGEFVTNLAPGKHTINWQAQDVQGNSASTSQEIWVYPSISFEAPSQRLGETQTAQVKLVLSGTSPEYPVMVNLSTNASSATAGDVTEDIDSLTVSFAEGETEKVIELNFIDDSLAESDETLVLEITDDFNSSPGNEGWTVSASQNIHAITVVDVAPTFFDSKIQQNGGLTTAPNNVDGSITLTANFTDTNVSDTLIYFWDLSSLNMPDSLMESASFDPSGLVPGPYTINVTATDNGLPSKASQQMILLNIDYGDSDKDGFNDDVDAFPNDASEDTDSDGDGVGDNADVFPNDKDETLDTDGDEVGDNADAFPNDASETKDSDGDGVGDNTDVFPNDKDETLDTDEDEVGDNADAFPNDASETKDSDDDGVGDNTDVFPNDKDETVDTDGDGVGDNGDDFPNDASKSRKLDDQSLEDTGAGSLHYLLILLLSPLMLYRRKRQ